MEKTYVLPYGMPRAGGPGVIPEKGNYRPGYGDPPLEPVAPLHHAEGYRFQPQVQIENGKLALDQDSGILMNGNITADSAEDVSFSSEKDNINGFYVCGDSKYHISDAEITFSGQGINDFEGWGAGVQVADTSTVLLENSRITTTGVIRPCTTAVGTSTMIVKNCELVGNGGTIDENTLPAVNGGMLQPPAGLGIGGNCRTHLSTGNSHCYFYNTKIIAKGWAALSTDAGYGDLYIETNRCEIETLGSGYGTFSDGGCYLNIRESIIRTATHGMILAGRCKQRVERTAIASGKYGAMIFTVFGHGSEISELTISGGSLFAGDDGILVKSANAYLDLRGVDVELRNGVLIHTVVNDDPMATKVTAKDDLYGVKAVLSDMCIEGNIIHEDTVRTMAVSLCHTSLTGKIENAALQMDASSHWKAAGDSNVVLYGDVRPGMIDAAEGICIRALSDTLRPQVIALPSGGQLIITDQVAPLSMPAKVGFE